jgi:murein L,D-transpeptidase YafK
MFLRHRILRLAAFLFLLPPLLYFPGSVSAQSPDLGRGFKAQLNHPRVRAAWEEKGPALAAKFQAAKVTFPPQAIFIRILKYEMRLELWARSQAESPYQQVALYDLCTFSGGLGPKRRQGDGQIPEGFYRVISFNPYSRFHLSLKVNYPNASDRILGDPRRPGGDIFIHGDCVSIGCVSITDQGIKEVYLAAAIAWSLGQQVIPVHLLPAELDDQGHGMLRDAFQDRPDLLDFWENLKQGTDFWVKTGRLPNVEVAPDGRYLFR